jgi:hypothetical protein
MEFQPREYRPAHQRNAPHFHLYVGLPESAELVHDLTDGRVAVGRCHSTDWRSQNLQEGLGFSERLVRWASSEVVIE